MFVCFVFCSGDLNEILSPAGLKGVRGVFVGV